MSLIEMAKASLSKDEFLRVQKRMVLETMVEANNILKDNMSAHMLMAFVCIHLDREPGADHEKSVVSIWRPSKFDDPKMEQLHSYIHSKMNELWPEKRGVIQ